MDALVHETMIIILRLFCVVLMLTRMFFFYFFPLQCVPYSSLNMHIKIKHTGVFLSLIKIAIANNAHDTHFCCDSMHAHECDYDCAQIYRLHAGATVLMVGAMRIVGNNRANEKRMKAKEKNRRLKQSVDWS